MLSIDEVIARERQQAKKQRSRIGAWGDEYSNKKCEVYAEYHEQIAEWLEDYKHLKEVNNSFFNFDETIQIECKKARNKAIDDFVKFANDMPTVEEEDGTIRPMWLEEMAERLKGSASCVSNDVCEWKVFDNSLTDEPQWVYGTTCGKYVGEEHTSKAFVYCPYCGKKIKVVE